MRQTMLRFPDSSDSDTVFLFEPLGIPVMLSALPQPMNILEAEHTLFSSR